MHQQFFDAISQIIVDNTEQNADKSLVNHRPDELSQLLNLDKSSPNNWQETLNWARKYYQHSINTAHPNFANRMWSGANSPSQLGEIITALTNTSSCTFESAPTATLMENYMLRQMLDLVGFKNGEGQMSSGSSNANMIAMLIARNKTEENTKQKGLSSLPKLFAFVSQDAHYSLDKAANILGVGTDNLIKVATTNTGQMDILALEKSLQKAKKQGGVGFFVCATLGTTVRGAYDNILEIVKLKNTYNFWLHGDGAWGGGALMSDKLRQRFLGGIEQLDSFTMDFHKMLGTNLMCNFLLVKHPQLLAKTCADGDNSYIFRDEQRDLGHSSLQCGQRVDSLKWFLDWKFYEKNGFAKRVERFYELTKFAENLVKNSVDLELITARVAFNLCFRFKAKTPDLNDFNQRLRDKLRTQNIALLALAFVGKTLIFRLAISNINLDEAKISTLLEDLIANGRELNL